MNYLSPKNDQCLLRIYVQPGASRNEISGLYGEPPRLKVKIKAPPVDGEANKEVLVFFAKLLGVSKSRIELERGETSRQKDLLIDLQVDEVKRLLSLED
ncbi:YggU family protein [Bacteriovorax stolpii]|uniref:UPF0235 protein C0V70_07225 n=1 Tax=Bacteriovorax stolpii TaxID=960 RepID=A0A2K9NQX3_BACTC|nr:DUF167 domain-containing protein [Bacteriovorax stolpii]AUN97901.1 YggU family protein [Bacteriovorax stolpii]QDK42113.1 YggU family protein [Bacteriovorax stolpii]TDP51732.1 hypothetical protein C8D79_3177 [Bacteriovorax stolpii]